MSNYGFHRAMEEAGVEVAVTKVGDRYVLDELREREWALGGEQWGHIIGRGFAATGDGIAAALMTMRELGGRELASVAAKPISMMWPDCSPPSAHSRSRSSSRT